MNKKNLIKEYEDLRKLLFEMNSSLSDLEEMLGYIESFDQWYSNTFSKAFQDSIAKFDYCNFYERIKEPRNKLHNKLHIYKNPDSLVHQVSRKLKQLSDDQET